MGSVTLCLILVEISAIWTLRNFQYVLKSKVNWITWSKINRKPIILIIFKQICHRNSVSFFCFVFFSILFRKFFHKKTFLLLRGQICRFSLQFRVFIWALRFRGKIKTRSLLLVVLFFLYEYANTYNKKQFYFLYMNMQIW